MSVESSDRLLDHLPHAPRRNALTDEVYESLKTLIMDHVIAPGERLNIDSLTRELGTSATPVREALARLESDGLATRQAMRGYSVAPVLTPDQIAELYELRLLIEPWAAARAAGRHDEAGIAGLVEELDSLSDAPTGSGHEAYRAFIAHDERLHKAILELAGNQTILQAFARTHAHLHLYRVGYGQDLGQQAEDEHAGLVRAIADGDVAAAEAAMREHLEAARDRLAARSGS
jgi:DNA-binding GntR family transcriptional regulator